MGRYYNGDIDGKFWFAVQESCDADFFGVQGSEPSELYYYFDKEDNLDDIKDGIEKCKEALGDWKTKLDKYFNDQDTYDTKGKSFKEQIDLDQDKYEEMLTWYARLELGTKILDCVEEHGGCSFTAEC